jgi:hypothetical protein
VKETEKVVAWIGRVIVGVVNVIFVMEYGGLQ